VSRTRGIQGLNEKLSYLGLIFPNFTGMHYYKTQTDTILFKSPGGVTFSHDKDAPEKNWSHVFRKGDAIQIPPEVIRGLSPLGQPLEIELIVEPTFDLLDEVLVRYVA
jgi:hypothetical protein